LTAPVDPNESRDDVLDRIEREHGAGARRVAEAAIDDTPPRRPRGPGTAPRADGAERDRRRRGAVTGPAITDNVSRGRTDEHGTGPGAIAGVATCSTDGCDHVRERFSLYCPDCTKREVARRRPSGTRSRANPMTDEEVRAARRMLAGFKSRREIAERFGVALSTLRRHGI
jgi:hypothetical protein